MSLFEKLENFLFQTPVWKLILFLFLIMLFKTGIFYHPNLHYHLDVAKNPYTNFFENKGNLDSLDQSDEIYILKNLQNSEIFFHKYLSTTKK